MTDRDYQSLLDIIQSIDLATDYLHNKTQADFQGDRILQDAIVRRIEIVGEAATRLSEQARNEMANIQWRQVIGMRNILIHQYDHVDLPLVWETATQALPQLKQTLQPYL